MSDDPKILLQWSDDDGHTWSHGKYASLGKLGKWKTRVVFRGGLGMARNRIFRVVLTEPVPFEIFGAWVEISEASR